MSQLFSIRRFAKFKFLVAVPVTYILYSALDEYSMQREKELKINAETERHVLEGWTYGTGDD